MEKELKSVTVYDKLNRKHVVKPGENGCTEILV